MANAERLKQVLTYIEQHPEEWRQSVWHCGSSHCFCGTAQILAGHAPGTGRIFDQVCEWLDLSRCEFDRLAHVNNTLEDLYRIVGDLVAGYDRSGYDRNGYDRNGYDCNGYNRIGYDRDGGVRRKKLRTSANVCR